MLFSASIVLDFCTYRKKAGMATAARMPMIATTIMSSIRVKPFISLLSMGPPNNRSCETFERLRRKGTSAEAAAVKHFSCRADTSIYINILPNNCQYECLFLSFQDTHFRH